MIVMPVKMKTMDAKVSSNKSRWKNQIDNSQWMRRICINDEDAAAIRFRTRDGNYATICLHMIATISEGTSKAKEDAMAVSRSSFEF
jgi:CYTH domain-containing protein